LEPVLTTPHALLGAGAEEGVVWFVSYGYGAVGGYGSDEGGG
jgi:hypothetical protein